MTTRGASRPNGSTTTGPADEDDDEVVGIAILNHPASFHFPTRWHVRDYGLFAANPFGRKEFPGGGEGGYTLASGKELPLRYRMILHSGDEKASWPGRRLREVRQRAAAIKRAGASWPCCDG